MHFAPAWWHRCVSLPHEIATFFSLFRMYHAFCKVFQHSKPWKSIAQSGPPLPRLKKTKELLQEVVFRKDLNLGPKPRKCIAQSGPPLPRLKKAKELLQEAVFLKDLNLGSKPWKSMAQSGSPLPGQKKTKELFQEAVFRKDLNLGSKPWKFISSKCPRPLRKQAGALQAVKWKKNTIKQWMNHWRASRLNNTVRQGKPFKIPPSYCACVYPRHLGKQTQTHNI